MENRAASRACIGLAMAVAIAVLIPLAACSRDAAEAVAVDCAAVSGAPMRRCCCLVRCMVRRKRRH